MSMYNLIEYSNSFSKTSGSLYQYYRDEPALNNNAILLVFLVITIAVFRSNVNSK